MSHLVGRPKIEELYSIIVHEAHQLIEPDFTGLIIQDENGRLHTVQPVVPESSFDLFEDPRDQGGVTRWVIDERQPRRIADTHSDPLVKPAVRDRGIRSMLAMPLIHHDQVLGVLYAHSLKLRNFSDHDVNLWQAYAALAAAALWSAWEQDSDVNRYRELNVELSKLAGELDLDATLQQIADSARVLARAEICLLAHVDPATRTATSWVSSPCGADSELSERLLRSAGRPRATYLITRGRFRFGKAMLRQWAQPQIRIMLVSGQHPWRMLPLYGNGRLLAVLHCLPQDGREFQPSCMGAPYSLPDTSGDGASTCDDQQSDETTGKNSSNRSAA